MLVGSRTIANLVHGTVPQVMECIDKTLQGHLKKRALM
jgi:hypothetical protein